MGHQDNDGALSKDKFFVSRFFHTHNYPNPYLCCINVTKNNLVR